MTNNRLAQQIRFVLEIDKLKRVLRQSLTTERRRENSSEHSWHIAVMAILLEEHANEKVEVLRVIKMLLIHDIVEVDAGDTYCYDEQAAKDQEQREQAAADRLFGMLPTEQAAELRALWDEFEHRQTPESKFANALDRLQPVLLNYFTDGESWRAREVDNAKVMGRNAAIGEGARDLWEYARSLIEDAVDKGYIKR